MMARGFRGSGLGLKLTKVGVQQREIDITAADDAHDLQWTRVTCHMLHMSQHHMSHVTAAEPDPTQRRQTMWTPCRLVVGSSQKLFGITCHACARVSK